MKKAILTALVAVMAIFLSACGPALVEKGGLLPGESRAGVIEVADRGHFYKITSSEPVGLGVEVFGGEVFVNIEDLSGGNSTAWLLKPGESSLSSLPPGEWAISFVRGGEEVTGYTVTVSPPATPQP